MKKALLVILDGFGMRKDDDFNALGQFLIEYFQIKKFINVFGDDVRL